MTSLFIISSVSISVRLTSWSPSPGMAPPACVSVGFLQQGCQASPVPGQGGAWVSAFLMSSQVLPLGLSQSLPRLCSSRIPSLGSRQKHLLALRKGTARGWSLTRVWLAHRRPASPHNTRCLSFCRLEQPWGWNPYGSAVSEFCFGKSFYKTIN